MLIILFNLLLFDESKALQELPDSITYHELVHYSTSSVKHEHNRHRRDLSSFLSLSFQAYNKLFNLRLSKNDDVFTKDAKFTSSEGTQIPYDFYSLVKGSVNGDDESLAHGYLKDGIFEGVITYQNETYHLEPSNKYYSNPDKHSLIYRFSDINLDGRTTKCGVKDEDGNFTSIPHHHSILRNNLYNQKMKYFTKRDTDDVPSTRYCTLYMAADYKFYSQHSSGFAPAIISKLGTYVQEINAIYANTVFPGYNHRVQFLISRAHVYETADNKYDRTEYAVAKFLDLFSTEDDDVNPNDYCIMYMFTHRDFEDGVLGLAWVASSGYDSGGLCTSCKVYEKGFSKSRCLNTGIVTTKNVKEVPAMQSYLTFGHELGHNLGSPHDPDSCSPGSANGGNFLMYPHANTGNNPNNKKLSQCSTEIMGPIIAIRGTCFESEKNVCGDFIKDPDEQCDCGDQIGCENDNCCGTDKTCTFKQDTYTCSVMDGVCCNTNICKPYESSPEAVAITCSEATDCKADIKCQAGTYECPTDDDQYWQANKTLCNGDTQVCLNGECTESLCIFADSTSCQCLEDVNKCKLCCVVLTDNGTECIVATSAQYFPQTALISKLNATTAKLPPGSVCGGDMGYCDIFHVCRIVDADGPIASLGNYIFNGVLFDKAQNVAIQYWYYCIMAAVGLVCFMVAFIAVCSKTVKPAHIPRGGERMSYPNPAAYKNMGHEMAHGHI